MSWFKLQSTLVSSFKERTRNKEVYLKQDVFNLLLLFLLLSNYCVIIYLTRVIAYEQHATSIPDTSFVDTTNFLLNLLNLIKIGSILLWVILFFLLFFINFTVWLKRVLIVSDEIHFRSLNGQGPWHICFEFFIASFIIECLTTFLIIQVSLLILKEFVRIFDSVFVIVGEVLTVDLIYISLKNYLYFYLGFLLSYLLMGVLLTNYIKNKFLKNLFL